MKKKILAILLVAMMVVSILPVSAFAEAAEEVEATCPGAGKTHTLDNCTDAVEKETVEGDCLNWGYTLYTCSVCNDVFADEFVKPVEAHKVSEPTEEAVAPTCTAPGKTAAGVCDVCGKEVASTEVPALGHEKAEDDEGAPCETEDGTCGAAFDCVRCDGVIIEEGAHDWCDMPEIVEEPTYFEDGTALYTCEKCGATKEVVIRCEHDCSVSLKWLDPVEPTCVEDGVYGHFICTECETRWTYDGEKVTLEDMTWAATGHNINVYNYASWFGYTTSGLYADGNGNVPYPDEGNTLKDGKYIGTSYADAVWAGFNVNGSFYKENGYHYIRTNVYNTYVESVTVYFASKAIGAGITGPKSVEVLYRDLNGNYVSLGVVDTVSMDTSDATYVKVTVPVGACVRRYNGAGNIEIRFTAQSNWTFVSEYEVVGTYLADWNFSGEITYPTCTTPGSITLPCLNGTCEYEEVRELAVTAHRYESFPIVSRQPTCTDYGFELYACDDCGHINEVKTLEPVRHTSFEDRFVWTEDNFWFYCDEGHYSWDKDLVNCAACVEEQAWIDDAVEANNNAYIDLAPTCTEDGLQGYYCGNCIGWIENVIPATGHKEVTVNVAPTCYMYGYSFTYCANEWCTEAHETVVTVNDGEDKPILNKHGEVAEFDVTVDGNTVALLGIAVDVEGGFDPDNHTEDKDKTYWLGDEPTCTTGGIKVFYCLHCDFYDIIEVGPNGHNFTMLEDGSNWEVKTEQTCTTAETWTVYCVHGCTTKDAKNNVIPVSTVVTNEEKPALDHEYSDKEADMVTIAPTCIADGYKFYDCTRCGTAGAYDKDSDKLVEKLNKLENKLPFSSKEEAEEVHVIDSWTVLREGTCERVGLYVAECSLCGVEVLAAIDNTGNGHTAPDFAGQWHVINPTTINYYNWNNPNGIIVVADANANTTVASKMGPNFAWWWKIMLEQQPNGTWRVIENDGTGSTAYESWTLGENRVVIMALISSNHEDAWLVNFDNGYAWPGTQMRSNLSWSEIVNADANNNVGLYFGNFWQMYSEYPAVNAGCVNNGYTAQYYCTWCGEFVASEVLEAKGEHNFDIVVSAKVDPTCTENGVTEVRGCSDCALTIGGEVIPATGHRRAVCLDHAETTCTQFGYTHVYCPTCGWEELWDYESAWGHDTTFDATIDTAAKCLVDGVAHCKNGECEYTEAIKAKGHVMTVGEGEDATKVYFGFCDQEVPANNKCEVCEHVIKAGDAPAHRQTSLNPVEVAATCVEYGYCLTTCDDCEWYSMVKIDELAEHQIVWDDEKYVAPTFHAAGSQTGTCSVCKGEFTEEIDALEGIGYYVSLDNAVVSGAELVDSATLAVTVSIDGNNADLWGVHFNVEYDVAVLKFAKAEFVTDTYNVLGEANDNSGHVTVVANLSNKDGSAVTLNAESALVVLYFTVDTDNKTVEDSVVAVKSVEAINNKAEAVAVPSEGSAKFDVAPYLDTNDDGAVNLADALYIYNIVTSGSGEYDASIDVDKDGVITLFDFIAVYKYLTGEFNYADMVNGGVKVEAPQA